MRITLLVYFLISSLVSNSQKGTYLEDLKSLQSVIQKTPSYKTQIKGDKLDQYKKLYDHLASDSITDANSFKLNIFIICRSYCFLFATITWRFTRFRILKISEQRKVSTALLQQRNSGTTQLLTLIMIH
jgi:hypothetical protein